MTLVQAYMSEIGEQNLVKALVGLDAALQAIPEDDRHREHTLEMLITRAECHLNLGHPLEAVSDCCQVTNSAAHLVHMHCSNGILELHWHKQLHHKRITTGLL